VKSRNLAERVHVILCSTAFSILWIIHLVEVWMKTNITLRMEETLVREAKILAASRGSSVSRMLAEELEKLIRRDREYEAARERALKRLEEGYDLGWLSPQSRDELHER
jgi:hypothetical protein